MVALGDKLDDVGVLGQLLAYVLNNLVNVHAGLVLGPQLGVVATRVEASLHKVEQVAEDKDPRAQLSGLVEVSV